ncbi:ankyrin repeat-containing domain protein [Dendryphion nanum]|uniref:Ankyrin repeat-containing domain protein n=1 Tax=Dendryphion nanum TaxID=256645 RepID=A0A9P9DEI8_9PLEO|nr:ankyrin repeat-containing domain protein [Dendryphion nanum]
MKMFARQRPGPNPIQSAVPEFPRLYSVVPNDGTKGDTTIDIIAVHGLETTSPTTWIAYEKEADLESKPHHWLKDSDMLPSIVKEARIWHFDYNSRWSHDAQNGHIEGVADTLLNLIQNKYDEFRSRALIFIGSCFGGIVVATALSKASHLSGDKRAIFDQTGGVVFLGTPLRGTKAANIAGWQNLIFGTLRVGTDQDRSNTLLKDIQENSRWLELQLDKFAMLTVRNQEQFGMQIRCFYETKKTQILNAIARGLPIKPPPILLVEKSSACLDCHESCPIEVRHALMNKFRGPQDPNFALVAGRVRDIVNKIREKFHTQEDRACISALSFRYRDQKELNPVRVAGTCEWLLDHPKFVNWRMNTAANILWITAGPGCGKSVLCKALVDEDLLYPPNPGTTNTSVCYFFFKDDVERGSAVNGLRSILHQLFKHKPWLIQHAVERNDGPNFSLHTLWDILIDATKDQRCGPVICVFDALDECNSSERDFLFTRLSEYHSSGNKRGTNLKFLLTSRPYHELNLRFRVEDLPSIQLNGDEKSEEIKREIDLVICHEIHRIGRTRQTRVQDNVQKGFIAYLKKQDNRTYLWVHLMLQEIAHSLESTERRLNQLVKKIPKSVDEAYERILERSTEPVQARRILHLILAAERPLAWTEMNIALEIIDMKECEDKFTSTSYIQLDKEKAFKKKIENYCGLFVNVIDGRIYLLHQTAKEFLITTDLYPAMPWTPSNWKHTFIPKESHMEVAKACLWYLQLDFPDISLYLKRLQDGQSRSYVQDYPQACPDSSSVLPEGCALLSYATQNWPLHLRRAETRLGREMAITAMECFNSTFQKAPFWEVKFLRKKVQKGSHMWRTLLESTQYDQHSYLEDLTEVFTQCDGMRVACNLGVCNALAALIDGDPGVMIDSKGKKNHRTSLSWEAQKGHIAVVELLLNTGRVDIDSVDHEGRTPLWFAVEAEQEPMVRLLLDRGANANGRGLQCECPLNLAIGKGNMNIVKLLLDMGADLNSHGLRNGNESIRSALTKALICRNTEMFQFLLQLGARATTETDMGDSSLALCLASEAGNLEVVKLLHRSVANVNTHGSVDYGDALRAASLSGQLAVVEFLLENGANINAQGKNHSNALHAASVSGHLPVVELLLENGANINAQGGHNGNALQAASSNGHLAVVELLLKNGANINAQGGNNSNALKAASSNGHLAVVKLLLKNRANTDAQGGQYRNALQAASFNSHSVVAKLMFENRADLNTRGGLYDTALRASVEGSRYQILRTMSAHDADVTIGDEENQRQIERAGAIGPLVEILMAAKKTEGNEEPMRIRRSQEATLSPYLHIWPRKRKYDWS